MNLNQMTLSRKFRTPLTSTLMILESLYTKVVDQAIRRTIMVVISEVNLLICLVNDLLDLKFIENAQYVAKQEEFTVKSVFQFILTMFAQQATLQKSTIKLEAAQDGVLPETLIGDKLRLKQVMVNLVKNAFKFGKGKDVKISASYDYNYELLIVHVSDAGLGFDEESLD